MDVGNSDAAILAVRPEPFVLIVGPAMRRVPAEALEGALRRMGLRPEQVASDAADGGLPRFRIHLGALSLLAEPATGATLDEADPLDSSTSLLATVLPGDWREPGHCWIFRPDAGAVPTRDLFTMMVLLIDLLDASHIFWTPARLWSDAEQYRAAIAETRESGMPPVLHLVAFRRREGDKGEDSASVGTRGLALFAGQELEARIPAGWTVAGVVRRLARLALDMMVHGPVRDVQGVGGLEAGEWVRLVPEEASGGGRATVRVEFGGAS